MISAAQAERLARIEQYIVEGEVRAARLSALIEQCRLAGFDTSGPDAVLQSFQKILESWMRRRAELLEAP